MENEGSGNLFWWDNDQGFAFLYVIFPRSTPSSSFMLRLLMALWVSSNAPFLVVGMSGNNWDQFIHLM